MKFVQYHITTINFYSAGRIGEFAKSDEREDFEKDSEDDVERDLKRLHFKVTTHYNIFRTAINDEFQDVCMFVMFNKEKRKTELCIKLIKDEKGKDDNL